MRAHEEYKESGYDWLGKIPAHWVATKLRGITKESNERRGARQDLELLSVYREYGVIIKNSRDDNHNAESEDTSNYKYVGKNYLVINKMKLWQGSLGVSEFEGIVSPAYIVCKLTKSINTRYLNYLLRSPVFKTFYNRISYGIRVGQWDSDYDDLKHLNLFLPPREEQDAIVSFLDAKCAKIDRLIKLKERQIELLNEKKQNVINQAVTKGLDPHAPMKDSGVDYIGVIPASWTVVPIHSVASVGNGSTPLRANTSFWHNGIFPWLNSGSVGDEIITQSEEFVTPLALSKCHLPIVKKDSLVMALTGQGKTRGKVAILEIEATINQHLAYITPNGKSVEIRFLKYVLDSMYGYIRLISDGNGSTKGGLTCFQIKHLKIALPSLKEQRDIVSQLDRINENIKNQINQAQRFIRLINEFKASLISDVVTGKINITDN